MDEGAPFDEALAALPATKAELYVLASRLKRMMLELLVATIEMDSKDYEATQKHFDQFMKISREMEPELEALVRRGESE